MVLLFVRAPFYVLLVFIAMCAVFWLFWLSYQYLPSDWLEAGSRKLSGREFQTVGPAMATARAPKVLRRTRVER